MNRFSHAFAAVAVTAIMWSATAPAVAAEDVSVATDVSAKSSPVKHRRMASVRHVRRVADITPLQRNLGCSGEWCGRQFVLMIGIGY